ncbi:MAG: hypothetical protein V1689_07660 [Pseudomonadota bacterium]
MPLGPIRDIREEIFAAHLDRSVTGVVTAEASGVLSGINRARQAMESLGLIFSTDLTDGSEVVEGQEIARVKGDPVHIAMAEEQIIGILSKPSGIATAAHQARLRVDSRCRVVAGGWKKMPLQIKDLIRDAVRHGGIHPRISENPFVYLDKNYVRILGGVKQAVQNSVSLGREIVVQVRGETGPVEDEAVAAAQAGAGVVMVDTGRQDHLSRVIGKLENKGLRFKVKIAFAGNIKLEELDTLCQMEPDIVDIGYAILDGPCLPFRFDVVRVD